METRKEMSSTALMNAQSINFPLVFQKCRRQPLSDIRDDNWGFGQTGPQSTWNDCNVSGKIGVEFVTVWCTLCICRGKHSSCLKPLFFPPDYWWSIIICCCTSSLLAFVTTVVELFLMHLLWDCWLGVLHSLLVLQMRNFNFLLIYLLWFDWCYNWEFLFCFSCCNSRLSIYG